MSISGLTGTLIRELTAGKPSPRIPEPDLIMDDPSKVRAFVRAEREAAIWLQPIFFIALTCR